MHKLMSGALALLLIAGCGGGDNPAAPDAGPDGYIPPPPPPPPPPPQNVTISGQLTELGSYLAETPNYVAAASVLMLGVSPLQSTISDATGAYSLTAPANGQVVFFANKVGYNPSYTAVTTQAQNVADQRIYITSNAWLNAIAVAHNVNLNNSFACHGPPDGGLDPADQCTYSVVIGRILDDGAAGNGTRYPVGGVAAVDYNITGPNGGRWYTKGPYFLNPDGTPNAGALTSIAEADGAGGYRGGLYVSFVEVPVAGAGDTTTMQYEITYNDQVTGEGRVFGPQTVQVYRNYSVSWSNIYETGVAPPPPPGPVDFDSQIYPLFLPVNQGGLGCQGCHTDQTGVNPAGGMNLYGGAEAAYAALDPQNYPQRVNILSPADSYLLRRPLYEAVGQQDHPIFAFASTQDPAYQLISDWISQGGVRTAALPPVSFRNDIRPILYQSVANGGAGCYNCHVAGVDAATAPGGFYMGGTPEELYAELVDETPTDNGGTGEYYRISKNGVIDVSLVLTNPLFGNAEPHPTKIFQSNLDTRYQLLYRWIAEGYVDDGAL